MTRARRRLALGLLPLALRRAARPPRSRPRRRRAAAPRREPSPPAVPPVAVVIGFQREGVAQQGGLVRSARRRPMPPPSGSTLDGRPVPLAARRPLHHRLRPRCDARRATLEARLAGRPTVRDGDRASRRARGTSSRCRRCPRAPRRRPSSSPAARPSWRRSPPRARSTAAARAGGSASSGRRRGGSAACSDRSASMPASPASRIRASISRGRPARRWWRRPTASSSWRRRAPFTLEGNLLMIDHGMGLNSAFLHLSRIDVRVGRVGAAGPAGRRDRHDRPRDRPASPLGDEVARRADRSGDFAGAHA